MKNKKKTALVVLWCIFTMLIGGVVGVLRYVYTNNDYGLKKPLVCDGFFSEWQSYIRDDVRLNETASVGSHDAGSYDMMPLAETQGHSIYDQLRGGVRYLDIRVTDKAGELVIYHGPIRGQKFSAVLSDIKKFMDEHPTEFLILNFQHLGKRVHFEVKTAIENALDMTKALNKTHFPDIGNILWGDVRAAGVNFMVIWKYVDEAAETDYMYIRNRDYYSFYDRGYHKSYNMQRLIDHYQAYYDKYNGQGFFVLQAQRTGPTLLHKPSQLETAYKPLINKYISDLKTSKNLDKTNIIMRDFVVSDMDNVRLILQLNITKNLIKPDMLNAYTAMVEIS